MSALANAAGNFDPRDGVWDAVWRILYEARYQASLAENLLDKWTKADDATKVFVAIFTSGSAVSGWAVWSTDAGKGWWFALAGLTSVIAIVHAALGVAGRLKNWGELKRQLTVLSIEIETFQEKMRIDPTFDLHEGVQNLAEYRKRYASAVELIPSDFLNTSRLKDSIQNQVDESFGVSSKSEGG